MMVPSIHLNGTSKNELLEQQIEALRALRAAIAALRQAAPNGRDYYPQGTAAAARALAEHSRRLGNLHAVETELEDLALAISHGGHRPS